MTREDRAAEIRAIHADLEAKMASLVTSEDWLAALATAAKFHRYSANNVLWLMLQAERRGIDLSHVAGFKSWQSMGRNVRKGEKALRVLAPAKYKVTDERTGDERWVVRGFTTACVFDISQTDGEPLAEVAPLLLVGDGTEAGALTRIVDLIEREGFTFDRCAIPGGANGFTDHSERRVCVRDDVTVAQALKTATHELAHVLLHVPEAIDYRDNRPRCEVEAESVAYVVLTHLGVTADEYSLPYVAGWAHGDVAVVKATTETVVSTAHKVIEALGETEQAQVAA